VEFCARDAGEIGATEQAVPGSRGTQVDVRDGAALTAWVADAAGRLGGLDGVVANVSALAIPDTEENWYASFEVDLMHTVRLVTAALPHLEASGRGSVVAVSSVSGREADFASGPYGTMKTAIVGYVSGLALQLAGRGVRANVVSPGNTFFEGGVWDQIQQGNRELYDMALGLNPTGHMGSPEQMARAVVFLSSPVSGFTSGTNLLVDGALTRGIQL
jgi:NAD(P)-dependent dehydrogenase (short-subunit alcohol dehydrogenase family)